MPEVAAVCVEYGNPVVVLVDEVKGVLRVECYRCRPYELTWVCAVGAEVAIVVALKIADADPDAVWLKRVRATDDVDPVVTGESDVNRVAEPASLHRNDPDSAFVPQHLSFRHLPIDLLGVKVSKHRPLRNAAELTADARRCSAWQPNYG